MEPSSYFLLYRTPEGTERVFHLSGSLVIGRAPSCDVVLSEDGVSREHCELRLTRSGVTLKDLGSTNGTFVNGSRITEAAVQPGGRIVVGQACLVLYQADPAHAAAARTGVMGDTTVEVVLRAAAERAPDAAAFRASGIGGDALGALFRVTDLVNSQRCAGEILREFIEILVDLFEMDFGAVFLPAEPAGGAALECAVTINRTGDDAYAPSRSVLQRVVDENVSVVAVDPLKDPRFRAARSIAASGAARILCAPMRAAGRVSGAVYLSSLAPQGAAAPGEAALQVLVALASQVAQAIENIRHRERLERDNRILRSELAAGMVLIGRSPAIQRVRALIEKVAATNATVLITGESGTGKELIAASIHRNSARAERPMISINCGAIPETMVETELFGHEKGAFTGAHDQRLGKFELASEGTLFLDEVGELPAAVQVKLLRALEEKTFYRVGGQRPVRVDVRIVAATNTDLEARASRAEFRRDLLFRLQVFQIQAPPLRDHREDIPELAAELCRRLGAPGAAITPAGMERLKARAWPGNVRELRNAIERELILSGGGPLTFEELDAERGGARAAVGADATLKEVERAHILSLLQSNGWNKSLVAEILGVSRPTLYDKIKQYGIEQERAGQGDHDGAR